MRDAPECLPPEGTDDFTMHRLSREVGDGSTREMFEALWTGGMWDAKGICPLSPRKAAWAGWQYEGPALVENKNEGRPNPAPSWLRGHYAGQDAFHQFKGPEPPPGPDEWRRNYLRGWVFAALNDQEENK